MLLYLKLEALISTKEETCVSASSSTIKMM